LKKDSGKRKCAANKKQWCQKEGEPAAAKEGKSRRSRESTSPKMQADKSSNKLGVAENKRDHIRGGRRDTCQVAHTKRGRPKKIEQSVQPVGKEKPKWGTKPQGKKKRSEQRPQGWGTNKKKKVWSSKFSTETTPRHAQHKKVKFGRIRPRR